jgi:hypothetical protein
MKKILFIFVAVMAFGFVSCDNKNESIVQDEVSKIEAFLQN